MPTPRLPQVGSDDNSWGDVLNEFLRVAHNEDGTLKNLSASEIADLLGNLTGDSRLSYSSLKDQLTGSGLVTLLSSLSDSEKLSYNALKDAPSSVSTLSSTTAKTEKKFKIKITPTNAEIIPNIQLSIPALKYNKKWAYVFCSDDAYLGIYQLIQKWINGQYVETGYYTTNPSLNWHDGMSRISGEINPTPLSYTDGCGNNIPFRVEMAFLTANNSGVDLHGAATPQYFTQIQYSEMQAFLDFFGVYNNHEYGGNPDAIRSLTLNEQNLYNRISKYSTVMTRPNGDNTYIEAAKILDYFIAMTTEGAETMTHLKDEALDLYKVIAYRKYYSFDVDNAEDIISNIQTKLASLSDSHAPLVYHFTHKISMANGATSYSDLKSAFQTIYNNWGAAGDDSVWVASYEEIMQYAQQRRQTVISRSVVGSSVIFDITIPDLPYFSWKEISFLVAGLTNLSDASVEVFGEAYGLSKAINSSKLLINIDYNKKSLELAEKYTALAEVNSNNPLISEYLHDAHFFVNRLRSEFKTYYHDRLSGLSFAPVLNSISINSGLTETANDTVSVSLDITGSASQYKISELADLSDANWQSYSGSDLNYQFTNKNIQTKTIYVKVQNDNGTSATVSSSISYLGLIISLDSVVIDSDASSTQDADVSVAITYSNSTPTHYRIGEVSDLSAVSWIVWTSSPLAYTLTSSGSRTVYVQIKDSSTESVVLSDSITYSTIDLQSIVIEGGAASVNSPNVNVALTYTGSPVSYMISESLDFSGATWISWSGVSGSAISFVLSGAGAKTIYFKMKDSYGSESSVVNDSITYTIIQLKSVKFFATAWGTGTMNQGTVNSETWNYGGISSSATYNLKDTANANYCTVTHIVVTALGSSTTVTLPASTAYANVFALSPASTGLQWYTSGTPNYDNTSKVRFGGLTPGKTVNLKVFGTENSVNNRTGRYRAVGETATNYQTLNAAGNLTNYLLFSGVVVPASGIIDLEWAAISPAVRAFLQIVEISEV